MANPIYTSLLQVVSSYIGQEKAQGLIERNLEKAGFKPDALDKAQLKTVVLRLSVAATLYIDDKNQHAECGEKIAALAA